MKCYVKTTKILKIDNGKMFTDGFTESDSIIIKYVDAVDKKVHVKRENIDKIGGVWMYISITPWVWNHKHTKASCCNRKIKIKNILAIKHFKNVLD